MRTFIFGLFMLALLNPCFAQMNRLKQTRSMNQSSSQSTESHSTTANQAFDGQSVNGGTAPQDADSTFEIAYEHFNAPGDLASWSTQPSVSFFAGPMKVGAGAIQLTGNAALWRSFSAGSPDTFILQFSVGTYRAPRGTLVVEYATNPRYWTELTRITPNLARQGSLALVAKTSPALHPPFPALFIRFRLSGSAAADIWYLDEVRLTGTQGPVTVSEPQPNR